MVITVPTERAKNGTRPINLNRDVPQVLHLLENVFGESLTNGGQRLFTSASPETQAAILWRLNPAVSRLSPGFVWEENGRIIGNVTLLNTRIPGRFLVANVAVHPDFRRRGISRALMYSVIELVRERRGHEILLQVVKDNIPALTLYDTLNFERLGSMSSWMTSSSRIRDLDPGAQISIRPLQRNEWHEAYRLDQEALPRNLNWPEPVRQEAYKQGWWRSLQNFLNGKQSETWVTRDGQGQLSGIITIATEWGRPHVISLRVRPAWRGQVERPLLAKAIRRTRYLARRNVRLDHPDNDEHVNALLQAAGFRCQRTLTHMRLDLGA